MTEQLSNFGSSTLLSSITDSAVTLTLASGDGDLFPTTGDFRIRVGGIDDAARELILVSGRSGDVLTLDTRGIEGTSAASHAAGDPVYQVVTKAGLENFIAEHTAEGPIGETGPAGATSKTFEQEGEVRLATGSKPWPLPFDCTLEVLPYCGTPPSTEAIEADVKVDNTTVFPVAANRPTIAVAAYAGTKKTVAGQFTQGQLVTVDITDCGSPSAAGGTLDVRDVSDLYSTFSGFTTGSAFPVPIPDGYQVGDLLVCFFGVLSDSADFYPTGWADLVTPVVDVNLSLRLYAIAKDAVASESGSQSVTLSGNAVVLATTLAIANAQVFSGQPDDSDQNVHDTNSTTSQIPALTVTEDNGLGLWAYTQRLGSGVSSTITLDAALTERTSAATTRVSATNLVLAVGTKTYTDAATTSAYTATGSGTGRWCSLGLTLLDGPTADTPGEDFSLDVIASPLV